MGKKTEMLVCLEKDLEQYAKVFLIWDPEKEKKINCQSGRTNLTAEDELPRLAAALCRLEMAGNQKQRILIMASPEIFDGIPDTEQDMVDCRNVDEDEAYFLFRLYHTYEFSDRFFIISRKCDYGSLFHFVDTGLLTIEEVAKALLY